MSSPEMRFDGRTAIVTGAGGGLGREYALLLASRGAAVIVNDPGSQVSGGAPETTGAAQAVVNEIIAQGGQAIASTDSVATAEGGASIVAMALDWTGSVDIVINNAGILRDRSFAKMTPDMFEAVLDVHLKGTFFVTQPAWQHMRDAHYGRVVNTSSNSGLIGNFGQANYGAAKAAILGLTRVLASEGAKYGIRVNAVAPMAATRMTESLLPPELVAGLDPAAVAPVVAWLAHESCPVTGNIYSAGGGRVARLFIGLTQGYYSDDLTVEQVAEHWAQVTDTDGAVVPEAPAEEIDQLLRLRSAYLAGRAG